MNSSAVSGDRRRLWRSRWAAIGAAVAVTLGGGGMFAVQAASSVPSSVVTIDPVRILDTRTDVGLAGPFVSAVSQKLQVTGRAGVPTGATGVLLNVTVVSPAAAGFLSVRPGDATGVPTTSSLNFGAGAIVPNSVQVGLPTTGANAGQIDITYDAFGQAGPTTEVLADVVGYLVAGGTTTSGPTQVPFEVKLSYGETRTIAENGALILSMSCLRTDPENPTVTEQNRSTLRLRAFSTGTYLTTAQNAVGPYTNTGVTLERALGASADGVPVQTSFIDRTSGVGAMTGLDGRQISVNGDGIQVAFNLNGAACYARGYVTLLPPTS